MPLPIHSAWYFAVSQRPRATQVQLGFGLSLCRRVVGAPEYRTTVTYARLLTRLPQQLAGLGAFGEGSRVRDCCWCSVGVAYTHQRKR